MHETLLSSLLRWRLRVSGRCSEAGACMLEAPLQQLTYPSDFSPLQFTGPLCLTASFNTFELLCKVPVPEGYPQAGWPAKFQVPPGVMV